MSHSRGDVRRWSGSPSAPRGRYSSCAAHFPVAPKVFFGKVEFLCTIRTTIRLRWCNAFGGLTLGDLMW
jgi:hypothetical protein